MMFHFMADVREVSAASTQASRRIHCLIKTEMRHMSTETQRVENEHIQVQELFPALRRDAIGVGAVGDTTNAETQYLKSWAVQEPNRLDGRTTDRKRIQSNGMDRELWDSSGMGPGFIAERIIIRLANPCRDGRGTVEWYRRPQIELHQPQIVQAENMVGMFVCVGHGVDDPNPLSQ